VCGKLGIKPRALRYRVTQISKSSGIFNRDIALLLLAHQQGIDVSKPRFQVPNSILAKFDDELKTQKTQAPPAPSTTTKKGTKRLEPSTKRLLNFKGKYPDIFYDRLEEEINIAYSNSALPNAVLILSRKLIENLVYNLLQFKLGVKGLALYYDTAHNRSLDFSVLIDNLQNTKTQFDPDQQPLVGKFLNWVYPFKRDANSKAHSVIEYLDSMSQVKKLKIVEMTQILLRLIERVRASGTR
jgi:hypothetical protein